MLIALRWSHSVCWISCWEFYLAEQIWKWLMSLFPFFLLIVLTPISICLNCVNQLGILLNTQNSQAISLLGILFLCIEIFLYSFKYQYDYRLFFYLLIIACHFILFWFCATISCCSFIPTLNKFWEIPSGVWGWWRVHIPVKFTA